MAKKTEPAPPPGQPPVERHFHTCPHGRCKSRFACSGVNCANWDWLVCPECYLTVHKKANDPKVKEGDMPA